MDLSPEGGFELRLGSVGWSETALLSGDVKETGQKMDETLL